MRGKIKGLMGFVLIATVVAACTEKRPYDAIYKGDLELQSKADVCNDEEYLYVPSTVETSRTTTATRPHWMGDAKRVRLECAEHEIRVVEVDPETKSNPTNLLPVLSIPVKHVDYKCSEDANGKCTNKEEENTDIPWNKKGFVELRPQEMKVQEVNWLPEQITNLFFPCFTPQGESLVGAKFEKDAINITLEKSFQTSIFCAGDSLEDLKELGFRVRYHYSLVKLSSIKTPDYKRVEYPRSDETLFGFFNTRTRKLDVDNNDMETGEKTYINRWAPGKAVVYQLSEGFTRPENKMFKNATVMAIKSINDSLKQANAGIQIELKDYTQGLATGDIRVNSIVLEQDPLAMGVIGYGPTAADPQTGEILHGRTVMYLGTIKKFIKYTYDEFAKAKLAAEALGKRADKAGDKVDANSEIIVSKALTHVRRPLDKQAIDRIKIAMKKTSVTEAARLAANEERSVSRAPANVSGDKKFSLNRKLLKERATNPLLHKISQVTLKDKLQFMTRKNCFFSADQINFNSEMEKAVLDLVEEMQGVAWLELSEAQKEKVLSVLTPYVWVPVMVHEIGHNLGLRHNFAGSEDKDNYYTKDELAAMGVSRPVKYSSVMDYAYTSTNELPVMGKYDIAALRFAYKRQVELKDGSIVSVDKLPNGAELKEYKFCTDEHVDLNPNCNVFDEGTTFTEMAEHHIRAYKEGYTRSNLRNGRRSFSLMSDGAYAARLENNFGSLRRLFERYEDIKHTFGLADDDEVWKSIDFLKDLKEATILAAQFFAEVLKTADVTCAVAAKAKPTTIIGVIGLRELSPNAISCFDEENVQLNPQYMIVGQGGKSFSSLKDPKSTNFYMDQIDVRGIWIDKLMALEALTQRQTGISSFDEYTDNFLDIADVNQMVEETLAGLVTDDTVSDVEFTTIFGQTGIIPINVRFFNDEDAQNSHRIRMPLDSSVTRRFGLPNDNVSFQAMVLKNLREDLPSPVQVEDITSLLNSIRVLSSRPVDGRPDSDYLSLDLGPNRFFTLTSASLASLSMLSYEVVNTLGSIQPEKLQKILEEVKKGSGAPKDASPAEKAAYELGEEILARYLDGGFATKKYYSQVIRSMSI